ncbi:MAG: hypothetical protein KY476_26425 [Planctomycetes bacterium]|nr:hypothetical protein [Planctomycetota bacterium]
MSAKEVKVPLGLIIAGLILVAAYFFFEFGGEDAADGLLAVSVVLVFEVIFGILALYIVSWLMNVGFGNLDTAAVKLAAIFLFPGAVALYMPAGLGWLVAMSLYVILLMWLLELEDVVEIVVCVLVIAFVRAVGTFGVLRLFDS